MHYHFVNFTFEFVNNKKAPFDFAQGPAFLLYEKTIIYSLINFTVSPSEVRMK